MLKSKRMLGQLSDMPFAIGLVIVLGLVIYFAFNYSNKLSPCEKDIRCVIEMKSKK